MKLSRKEREAQFRLNIVLDAAADVFAESSYANASVEEIAKRAEISVGTLYNLFASKEQIYCKVVSRAQNQFFQYLQEKVGEARGPKEKISATVRCHFEHFSRWVQQWRLYVSASNGFQWELKSKLIDEAVDSQKRFMDSLTDICQQGMDAGIFKKGVPAEFMALTIMGVPHSFLVYCLDEEGTDIMSLMPSALKITDRIMGTDID